MGTRNLTAVMIDGEYKIAQYCQWDGYPDEQGAIIYEFLKQADLELFKEKVRNLKFISKEEYAVLVDLHTDNGRITLGSENDRWWKEEVPHFDRDMGARVLQYVMDERTDTLQDNINFAGDSLYCEWAYVVDFDKGTFEVFEGFNKTELSESERFFFLQEKDEEYKPVRLIASFDLLALPETEGAFLKEVNKNIKEDEEE